jgi:hypothetical protein
MKYTKGEAASEWLYGPWRKVLLAVGAAVIVLLLLRRRALAAAGPGARVNTTVTLAIGSKVILTPTPANFLYRIT